MAIITYITAPWSMRVMLERRWGQLPAMLLATWLTVDGCYWLYWRAVDPVALELMREANWPASLSLYWTCGVIWLYRGRLRDLMFDVWRALQATAARLRDS
jgi:hypothetical protein